MAKGVYWKLLAAADAEVKSIDVDTMSNHRGERDFVVVDVRDVREVQRDGMILNAFHAPRGMLEFWIDEDSPYHKPIFAEHKTFVFYCASGWRSLLAAQTAQRMGLKAMSLRGGFSEWKTRGHPTGTLATARQSIATKHEEQN